MKKRDFLLIFFYSTNYQKLIKFINFLYILLTISYKTFRLFLGGKQYERIYLYYD